MDMQMPVVDGYEATHNLRSRGYHRPIIAMTAYAWSRTARNVSASAATIMSAKPIDWNQLVTILGAHVLHRSSSGDSGAATALLAAQLEPRTSPWGDRGRRRADRGSQ